MYVGCWCSCVVTPSSYLISEPGSFDLYEAAVRRRSWAYRPGTRRNFITYHRVFIQFCLKLGIPVEDPTVDDLSAFAEWLVQAQLAPATIRNYLSAIKTLYLSWNTSEVVEAFNSYSWALTLKAITLSVRPPSDNRSAITFPHLEALVLACQRDRALWPLRVALVFGYLGYLRVSNLAPESVADFDQNRHTTWQDVFHSKEGVLLAIKWSKTRQAAAFKAPVPLPALGLSSVCPVATWQGYVEELSLVPRTPQSPLLLSTMGPPGRIITIPILRALLRRAAHLAGLTHCHYTPHSWRRGGASFSFLAGVPLEHIKFHGTWTSDAINDYLFSTPHFNTPVARSFVDSLKK